MNRKLIKSALGLALGASLLSFTALAGEVEVLHWWTSGGEAKAVAELKEMMETQGHSWEDFAVAGGAGAAALTVLKSRVVAGNPPTAAQLKGPAIKEWGELGVLANLDDVAREQNWDEQLSPAVANIMKYDDHYVAVPVNVHRVNWLWVNPEVFEKAGAKAPKTWAEFEQAAQKIREAGFIPVAHGGQAWQDATVFEALVLGVGGADFYRKVFVELDDESLNSPTMIKAFERLRTYKTYTDKDAAGRDWNLATAMVINGKAGMQIMGDWAKGEFLAADKTPGEDFLCVPVPDTQGAFTFNVDSFVMFDVGGEEAKKAQADLAKTIMSPEFQKIFNLNKGSIPVRQEMVLDEFDACAKSSMEAFVESSKNDALLPSLAHGMAVPPDIEGAITDVITSFFNSDMAAEDAAKRLAQAVQYSKL